MKLKPTVRDLMLILMEQPMDWEVIVKDKQGNVLRGVELCTREPEKVVWPTP